MPDKAKIVVVMPAYNAARTLHMTYAELPHDVVDLVIVVDDGSSDETIRIARKLGLELFVHDRNYGYEQPEDLLPGSSEGGREHHCDGPPDYQIHPNATSGDHQTYRRRTGRCVSARDCRWECDASGNAVVEDISNRFLTGIENAAFGLKLSEYHTGYRAYRREALESVNLDMNSDNFIFDQEIMAQFVELRMRVAEVPVPTRYFPQASSASFVQSSIYGMSILWLLLRYELHRRGMMKQRQFESLHRRYSGVSRQGDEPAHS